MELFLMRHGSAQPHAREDALRALTQHGEKQTFMMTRQHVNAFASVQKILVSPYVRAQQTASIVLTQLNPEEKLPAINTVDQENTELLVPMADVKHLEKKLYEEFHENGIWSLMVVSHLPLLNILLDRLCGFEAGRYHFAPSSIAALDMEALAEKCCVLRWLHHADGVDSA